MNRYLNGFSRKAKRTARGTSGALGLKARVKRQAPWIALFVGCLAFGYGLGRLAFDDKETPAEEVAIAETAARPWYRIKPTASQLVASEPILQENGDGPHEPPAGLLAPPPAAPGPSKSVHAYEEALPTDAYLPGQAKPRKPIVVDEAARPAWMRNAVAYADPGTRPIIAIVIDDLGIDHRRTERTLRLSGPLTLSFLSYAPDLPAQMRKATGGGHELLLHVGMEPKGKSVDPGPDALLVSHTPEILKRRLARALDRSPAIVGINNHMGSLFTENRAAMTPVIAELQARGLLFLDSRTSPNSVAADVAHDLGVPVAERNVFLDNENAVSAVRARLKETERIAEKHGFSIAIGHPRDATIEALGEWLADIGRRGFTVVPLSAIVKRSLHLPA